MRSKPCNIHVRKQIASHNCTVASTHGMPFKKIQSVLFLTKHGISKEISFFNNWIEVRCFPQKRSFALDKVKSSLRKEKLFSGKRQQHLKNCMKPSTRCSIVLKTLNLGRMPLETSSTVPIQKSACLVACAPVKPRQRSFQQARCNFTH